MYAIMLDGEIVWEGTHLELALSVCSMWEGYNLNVRLCVGPRKKPVDTARQ